MGRNDDLIKASTAYMAGQAIMRNAAYNLQKEANERAERSKHITPQEELQESIAKYVLSDKQEEAFEWLNECIQTEIIGEAKQQKINTQILDKQIEAIKVKYTPFYDKIGMSMPENIADITGKSICDLLGIELLTQTYYKEQEIKRENQEMREGCSTVFRVVFLIGFILFIIYVTTCAN